MVEIPAAAIPSRFGTFAELRSAHNQRRRGAAKQPGTNADPAEPHDDHRELREFIDQVAETGTVIASGAERDAAQGILDFWTSELISTGGMDKTDWVRPRLAPHHLEPGEARAAPQPAESDKSSAEAAALRARARDQIRIAALARQWRDAEPQRRQGYLLKGKALEDAQTFRGLDPDIEAFVAASEVEETKGIRVWRGVFAATAALLAALLVLTFVQWWKAEEARDLAEKARVEEALLRQEAERLRNEASNNLNQTKILLGLEERQRREATEQRERASETARKLEEANRNLELERNQLQEQRAKAIEELGRAKEASAKELEAQKERLTLPVADYIRLIREGRITFGAMPSLDNEINQAVARGDLERSELPDAVQAILGTVPQVDILADTLEDPLLKGFAEEFLEIPVRLPVLGAELRSAALRGGAPLNYVNYSIVFSQRHRMAIYSASNLDRRRLRVLPRAGVDGRSRDRFAFDPRLSRNLQIGDNFYAPAPRIDRGHLVTRAEISWGPFFDGDSGVASQRLAAIANLFTNATPQFANFNQGIWLQAERWVQTRHNRPASRVSIFSGAVLDGTGPTISGVKVPRSFWKIAVSNRSGTKDRLIVDAFLIQQAAPDGSELPKKAIFDPNEYRVAVTTIEELTGLDFGSDIRRADTSEVLLVAEELTPGEDLAARVRGLDAATASERRSVAGDLVRALTGGAMPEIERRKVAAALVELASPAAIRTLSVDGRFNLLSLLSEIPGASWNDPKWIDLKAVARRAVVDFETAVGNKAISDGTNTMGFLTKLKEKLGLGAPAAKTVYLQFAGMTREKAEGISASLQRLGWNIPGEERTEAAVKQNEIRYGDPKDQAGAELLAADLRALGLTRVRSARRNVAIKSGFVEIWISD